MEVSDYLGTGALARFNRTFHFYEKHPERDTNVYAA